MARRGSRPSLYEVARTRLDRGGQGADPTPEQPGEVPPPPPPRFTPGSSLRLPMGFVVVGIVLVLGLITLAWWLGKAAGQVEARIDAQRQGLTRVLQDPLEYQQSPATNETPPPEAAGSLPVPPPEPAPAVAEPPLDGDPRVLGLHYYVLAETRLRGAEEVAAFCRGQGLDAAVISGDNTGSTQVIALPGLVSVHSTDPARRALAARIEEVGRRWKQSGGWTNFSDKYLQRKVD